MMFCPTCMRPLARRNTADGRVYACSCGGRAATFEALERVGREDVVRRIRLRSLGSAKPSAKTRRCPVCSGAMTGVDFPLGGGRGVILDACSRCRLVWFDPSEYEALGLAPAPRVSAPAPVARVSAPMGRVRSKPVGPPMARLAGSPPPPRVPRAAPAAQYVQPSPPPPAPAPAAASEPTVWQIVPALFGLPIEMNRDRLRDKPVVTHGLVAIMVGLFALCALAGPGVLSRVVEDWGMIPARWARHGGLTLLTSFFLHASWWHVIANMYFLWIFGDNVEDRLGHLKFILLLAFSHAAGMWVHGTFGASANVPCVGASAGISGVLAYYGLVFPAARIGFFGWILTLFRVLRLPAIVWLLVYAGLQAWGAFASGGGAGVAYLAHLGGLAAGALCALFSLALSK